MAARPSGAIAAANPSLSFRDTALTAVPRSVSSTRQATIGGINEAAADTAAARVVLRHLDVVVLQWKRADALARRLEERIEHRGRRHADRRLAHAAPGVAAAGRDDNRFDLWHFGDAHRVVGVEVGLLDAAVLDRALLIEQ